MAPPILYIIKIHFHVKKKERRVSSVGQALFTNDTQKGLAFASIKRVSDRPIEYRTIDTV